MASPTTCIPRRGERSREHVHTLSLWQVNQNGSPAKTFFRASFPSKGMKEREETAVTEGGPEPGGWPR